MWAVGIKSLQIDHLSLPVDLNWHLLPSALGRKDRAENFNREHLPIENHGKLEAPEVVTMKIMFVVQPRIGAQPKSRALSEDVSLRLHVRTLGLWRTLREFPLHGTFHPLRGLRHAQVLLYKPKRFDGVARMDPRRRRPGCSLPQPGLRPTPVGLRGEYPAKRRIGDHSPITRLGKSIALPLSATG
jgi:hypothetical protein